MSAYVTCFLSCPLSSNKCQIMIRGGTSAPSTAFFRTSRSTTTVNKSPMKVLATIMVGNPITPTNGTSGRPTVADPTADAVVGTTSPNMKVVADNDNQLVLEFHWPGVLSKLDIKHRVSKDYDYLIIEGKEKEDGAGKGASGSLMWSKSVAYDTHFRLPENWDKSSKIKAAFDAAREVVTIKVAKSKGLDDVESLEWE